VEEGAVAERGVVGEELIVAVDSKRVWKPGGAVVLLLLFGGVGVLFGGVGVLLAVTFPANNDAKAEKAAEAGAGVGVGA
jgi:hypothetical protein